MLLLALTLTLTFTNCSKTSSIEEVRDETGVPEEPAPPVDPNAKQYTLVPDKDGRLVIDNKSGQYQPGDILNLKGTFYAVIFYNLSGSAAKPIVVRNEPGTVVKIGNTVWDGGSWSTALSFVNSRYVKVGGTSASDFIINGSTKPNRNAYFDLSLSEHSDNFEIGFLTITNGGTGIWAKTDPVRGDASTYYPNSYMENLSIHDVSISGTNNEAMYIGHTATYWNLATNQSVYELAPGQTVGGDLVQPIKWRNVKIYNNKVKDIGADGIQTAAIDRLEVYNNDVTNWGLQHNPSHSGGLLIGGRVTNSNVHDNQVHDGWGDLCQFFGSGENSATHIFTNNLFRDNTANDGVTFRGTDDAVINFSNNTVARAFGVALRINGLLGQKGKQLVSSNAFIQPRTGGGVIDDRAYIYTENGGQVTESSNTKFATTTAAGVDNNFQPLPNSGLLNSGYRVKNF
ncbi:right-handed parallel beta-helix repeat-containing protein [Chitinophaga sp. SYP-B3965]|uniref:right-handed parallel beta-helix repeat-containing protein n=1 Tax=Chitinophaga sp. SYP-B3965 TaxID=2663120 RepID=UPI0020A6CCA0|nr:right-handed parallel beta-helix repeat-containing protein [Chitinophaga sp. SYP-B3965]